MVCKNAYFISSVGLMFLLFISVRLLSLSLKGHVIVCILPASSHGSTRLSGAGRGAVSLPVIQASAVALGSAAVCPHYVHQSHAFPVLIRHLPTDLLRLGGTADRAGAGFVEGSRRDNWAVRRGAFFGSSAVWQREETPQQLMVNTEDQLSLVKDQIPMRACQFGAVM